MAPSEELDYDRERAEEMTWRLAREQGVTRRRFLELAGIVGAGYLLQACGDGSKARPGAERAAEATSTTSPAPPTTAAKSAFWVKPVLEDKFVVHNNNAEMRWDQMGRHGYSTPSDLFFVRNHTRTPTVDPTTWRLRVEGTGVARPLDLTLDELRKVGAEVTVLRSVECAGNGRVFFDEVLGMKAEGSQWRLGAIGVAEWTGVPLGAVLERAGVKRSTRDVMPIGLDELKVQRPVPLAKAMADDTLLAYAMNGEELPPDHGAPVRALVPGWIGVSSVKWVGRIHVAEEPLFSDWNTTSYVLVGPGYQPEGRAKGPAVTTQVVKSALELPWPAQLGRGPQTLHGRSWSGTGSIKTVEVRVDHGPWAPAPLEAPNEPAAWVRWSYPWEASPGEHTISVRATDSLGNRQPDSAAFNQLGYLYGAVVAHPVSVS